MAVGMLLQPFDELSPAARRDNRFTPFISIPHPEREFVSLILFQLQLRILGANRLSCFLSPYTEQSTGGSHLRQQQPDFAINDLYPALRLQIFLVHSSRRSGQNRLFQPTKIGRL